MTRESGPVAWLASGILPTLDLEHGPTFEATVRQLTLNTEFWFFTPKSEPILLATSFCGLFWCQNVFYFGSITPKWILNLWLLKRRIHFLVKHGFILRNSGNTTPLQFCWDLTENWYSLPLKIELPQNARVGKIPDARGDIRILLLERHFDNYWLLVRALGPRLKWKQNRICSCPYSCCKSWKLKKTTE